MSDSVFANYGDVVSDVLSTIKKDAVLHVLVLTYEFDEQQLVNLVCSRNLEENFELRQAQLKVLSNMRPLVIYDARKSKSFSKVPQFLELHPYKAAGFTCHHSKAYLIVTEKTIRLALGSFNLTATGIFKNREVFEDFFWDTHNRTHIAVLSEWIDFLQNSYATRLKSSSHSALSNILETLRKRTQEWSAKTETDEIHLIHSGYKDDQDGLKMLRSQWEKWFPGKEPYSLLAVSPFFDESPQTKSLANDIHGAFPNITTMTLITDQHVAVSLCKAHFGPFANNALLLIPGDLGEVEKQRIERLARQTGNSIKDQLISRKLHAKILMLYSDDAAVLYLGSANFSRKAWRGNNQELGAIFKEHQPTQVLKTIIQSLGASVEDHYRSLPSIPLSIVTVEDDEGYSDETNFPGFIELIQLAPNQDCSAVQFRFEVGERGSDDKRLSLDDYVVQWAGVELVISHQHSHWIERQEFQSRLVGARSLSFQHKTDTEKVYWFPFQYEGKLIAERETFLHPSSWDWMAFYLNPDRESPRAPGEFIPGEENNSDDPERTEVDSISREDNCVIAMQGYLTLFSRVESDFFKRIDDIKSLEFDQSLRLLKQQVIDPLLGFSRLLEREATESAKEQQVNEISQADVFKMGELLQLVNTLQVQTRDDLKSAFDLLQSRIRTILSGWKGKNKLRTQYLKFVIAEDVS
jgi:hypothetical protein